jgi:hypothetical protein
MFGLCNLTSAPLRIFFSQHSCRINPEYLYMGNVYFCICIHSKPENICKFIYLATCGKIIHLNDVLRYSILGPFATEIFYLFSN